MFRFLPFRRAISCALFVCAFGAAESGAAVPAVIPASSPGEMRETIPSAPIAPHRAIYAMKMGSVKNGSAVSGVSGRMSFEWSDVCDGWTTQQRMQLHFIYSDGDEQDLVSSDLAWEAKNGKRYNFNIRRSTNGQETERYRGNAVRNPDGTVSVSYSVPDGKTLDLPAGTLFPSAHTELILREATGNENFFSRRVFDGSDDEGSSDISAFISKQRPEVADSGKTGNKNNPLLTEAPWPVHLAFFKVRPETPEPDYEMDMSLLPNGVVKTMKVDYGDFSVIGTLEEAQALRPVPCP